MSSSQPGRAQTLSAFQGRLQVLIARTGLTQSRFAERAGLDRSTMSLLLSPKASRLPRAETIARIAASHGASADWLLGLSQEDEIKADIMAAAEVARNADDPADAQLKRWQVEAQGSKIRYVPSSIPDQLKTAGVIAYESGRMESEAGEAMAQIMRERIAHARSGASEIEVCSSVQSLEQFARGEGIWNRLSLRERRRQLEQMVELLDDLYPGYRWFLFDGREAFAAPYTVFGQRRAAIYLGGMYFVFTSSAHVRELTQHFDTLIRRARVQPDAVPGLARKLLRELA